MLKISIIVPIYNVEAYLKRCVDSILNQTYQNIEIILVNDGSPDNCPQLCDVYASRDSRVKVIHQNNCGVSVARNTGIDAATGDYIAFVDADDWIEPQMCESLVMDAEKFDADFIMFDPEVISIDGKSTQDSIPQLVHSSLLQKQDFTPELLRYFAGTIWRCVYRKDLIRDNNISFPVGLKLFEDRIFNMTALGCAKKIYYHREVFYHYYILSTGACQKYYEQYFDIVCQTDDLTCEVLNKYWDSTYIPIYKRVVVLQGALGAIYQICSPKNPDKSIVNRYLKIKKIVRQERITEAFQFCTPVGIREKLLKRQSSFPLMIVGYLFNIKNQ